MLQLQKLPTVPKASTAPRGSPRSRLRSRATHWRLSACGFIVAIGGLSRSAMRDQLASGRDSAAADSREIDAWLVYGNEAKDHEHASRLNPTILNECKGLPRRSASEPRRKTISD